MVVAASPKNKDVAKHYTGLKYIIHFIYEQCTPKKRKQCVVAKFAQVCPFYQAPDNNS